MSVVKNDSKDQLLHTRMLDTKCSAQQQHSIRIVVFATCNNISKKIKRALNNINNVHQTI